MNFAKWVFRIAGIYGIITLFPMYFVAGNPQFIPAPAPNHLEYYYGFIGVALAFQLVFQVISMDPAKYRALMFPSVVEKATFAVAVFLLLAQQGVSAQIVPFAAIDSALGTLFILSYFKTRPE